MRRLPFFVRRVAWCALLLACLVALGPFNRARASAPRDWKSAPGIAEIDTLPRDIYALGDVHGDYGRLVTLLLAANLLADKPAHAHQARWSAGSAVLICTGDMIDKGEHSLKVIGLLRALQTAARDAKGQVIVTMGNHEGSFLADPANHKAKEFIADLHDHDVRPEDVARGRDSKGIGTFLNGLPLAARLGDWFFAHAGNTRGLTLKQLDRELRLAIDAHGYDVELSAPLRGLVEDRLHPAPWWEQKGDTAPQSRERLAGYLRSLGVRHLVLGHQPGHVRFSDGSRRHKGTLCQKFDGQVFLIDVGMSRGIEGGSYNDGALLHIRDGKEACIIYPTGEREILWRAGK